MVDKRSFRHVSHIVQEINNHYMGYIYNAKIRFVSQLDILHKKCIIYDLIFPIHNALFLRDYRGTQHEITYQISRLGLQDGGHLGVHPFADCFCGSRISQARTHEPNDIEQIVRVFNGYNPCDLSVSPSKAESF